MYEKPIICDNAEKIPLGYNQLSIASLLNHSCFDNVEAIDLCGPRTAFFSKQSIKKDEKVFRT